MEDSIWETDPNLPSPIFHLPFQGTMGLFTWISESIKSVSDAMVLLLLRSTSQFESELTREGREEQRLWRDRRTRNLKGLALRARRRARRTAS